MRKLFIAACSATLLVGGLSLRAIAADDKAKTVEGELVDTHCYAAGAAKGEGHATCGAKCAKSGIPVALLADGKAWTLATNPAPLADDVGKTIRVTGTPNAEAMIMVPDKIEVKDGDSWKEVPMADAHHKAEDKK